MTTFTTIISAEALKNLSNPVILDCRARLGDPEWGLSAYLEGHIAGAQYVNLDTDLADPPGQLGRHPLPDRDEFLARVKSWGVATDRQVVVYDNVSGAMAARAWWMLRWIGHDAVAVLDGGLQSWSEPLSTGREPAVAPGDLSLRPSLTQTITVESLVSRISSDSAPVLLDARAYNRWAGREEPIDTVAGHIPGAACMPFQENLDNDGYFKSAEALRARFLETCQADEEVVCYCGSGVTAAHNILAMRIAGLPEPALYVGSWSGWITNPERPVATAN